MKNHAPEAACQLAPAPATTHQMNLQLLFASVFMVMVARERRCMQIKVISCPHGDMQDVVDDGVDVDDVVM